MLSVWIMLVVMLVVSASLAVLVNRRIEECVPVCMTGTIVFLYIFYYLNLLSIGRIALYAVSFCLLVAAVFCIFKRKKSAGLEADGGAFDGGNSNAHGGVSTAVRLKGQLFTPALILFLALSVLFLLYAQGMKPAVWDELRLWASMPKALHFSEALQVGEGSLLYSTMQSYPPGMALLIYYFTALTGPFTYGSLFAVYWIFMAALILPALKHLKWSQWYVLGPVFFVMLIIPILLTVNGSGPSGDWNFFFTSLYIDPMLGCLMGYAFYQAVKEPFRNGFSLTAFSLTLFVLPAFKNTGGMYASAAFVLAAVIFVIAKVKERKTRKTGQGNSLDVSDFEVSGGERFADGVVHVGKAWYLPIPLIAAGIAYISWQIMIHVRGTGEFVDFNLGGFTGEKLGGVLKGLTTWGTIPFVYYVLFFLAAGLFATFILKDISKQKALFGGLAFLLIFLIFFYGYVSHYGLMLSSIHRYTSTFTFAFFIYLLMRYVSAIDPKVKMLFVKNEQELKKADALERRAALKAAEEAQALEAADGEEAAAEDSRVGNANDKKAAQAPTVIPMPSASDSVLRTLLPKRTLNAGRVLAIELLLAAAAIVILFYGMRNQLKNDAYTETTVLIPQAEELILEDQQAGPSDNNDLVRHPVKTYLALGGDIRKESQKHETYALEAIGSGLNIQNIWCDKLFNEAEDGEVTDHDEMTRIWAESLKEDSYQYVLVANPDSDILGAIEKISNAAGKEQGASKENLQSGTVLKVLPAENVYGIQFEMLR